MPLATWLVVTLSSSCDVWREQGEGAASDPQNTM
jgi:hypothetical protein